MVISLGTVGPPELLELACGQSLGFDGLSQGLSQAHHQNVMGIDVTNITG
jgi:hypothetical protein